MRADPPRPLYLVADIEAGSIDTVVVYELDWLTRSLADFAKIVEVLDAKGAAFSSVTRQLSTTTSVGRLTANMLLSFARFERWLKGAPIGDRFATSKRRRALDGRNGCVCDELSNQRDILNT